MITHADVVNRAQEKLKGAGLEKVGGDLELLTYFEELIFDEITLNINWDYIPTKLETLYIDMILGEYLYQKYLSGDLDFLFGEPDPIKQGTSVKVGNVTVGLKTGTTKEEEILAYIDRLKNPRNKRYLMDIVRKAL